MADTKPQDPIAPQTPAEAAALAAQQQKAIEADLEKTPRDETIPGGKYRRAGFDGWFNAAGKQIDKDGKVLDTE